MNDPIAHTRSPFLTAQWRHVTLLNYEIDPGVLSPYVPVQTELDDWKGHTFVSLVGFLFLNTRVGGIPIPWHRNFEEVNLRFYVRRRTGSGWRRAVIFIREIVPRAAVAMVARRVYGERYIALPMGHRIRMPDSVPGPWSVEYSWTLHGRENRIQATGHAGPSDLVPGSDAEFLTEHYWGITRNRRGKTSEYRVDHPRWRVRPAEASRLECDVAGLYGEAFVESLSGPPFSAFVAEGSEVAVHKGVILGD